MVGLPVVRSVKDLKILTHGRRSTKAMLIISSRPFCVKLMLLYGKQNFQQAKSFKWKCKSSKVQFVAVIDNYITLRSLYCCSSKTGKLQAKASSEKYCKAAKNKAEWQLKLCYTTCIGVTHAAYVLHNLCTGYKYISLQKSIAAVCMQVAHVCRKACASNKTQQTSAPMSGPGPALRPCQPWPHQCLR